MKFFSALLFSVSIVKVSAQKIITAEQKQILDAERQLRIQAYAESKLKLSDDFFDNLDLNSDYFIILAYHKKTMEPLLSARFYYSYKDIQSSVKKELLECCLPNDLVFIDRMSANQTSNFYHQNKRLVQRIFHIRFALFNYGRLLIGMVRSEPNEWLLKSKLRVGLLPVGESNHLGIKHWIISGKISFRPSKGQSVFYRSALHLMSNKYFEKKSIGCNLIE